MKINANKGMFIESIINNTAKYYEKNKIAIIRKQWVPIKIHHINGREMNASLSQKCDVDYYGMYAGKFFAFEAKQCSRYYFEIDRLKSHQIEFLKLVEELNGIAFIIFYFQLNNKVYLLWLKDYYKFDFKSKRIKIEWFDKYATELTINFPGWLDIIKEIKMHQ